MYYMVKSVGIRRMLQREAPAAVAALVVAEMFYKFGSFVLECVAFLATWYVLSLLLTLVLPADQPTRKPTRNPN